MSSSTRETASYILGVINVIVWVIAKIPQIIINYTGKSAKGLSLTFLFTWIIGSGTAANVLRHAYDKTKIVFKCSITAIVAKPESFKDARIP
ncbi:hypothetical protein HN51_044650, partial [Arachis hypogaea]